MSYLYLNSNGFPVTRHSNSGSDDFRFCARKYKLHRIDGWTDRSRRVAMDFGNCVEAALRYHHQHNLQGGAAEFDRLWAEFKDKKDLIYSAVEKDWESLALSGNEMLRLYAAQSIFNPDADMQFQVKRSREVFPGTALTGIEFVAYIDVLLDGPEGKSIVDIKTSGAACPTFLMLDPQLRNYAWITGIPNVGFLWFRKKGRAIKTGDEVSFLEKVGPCEAGESAIVAAMDEMAGVWLTRNENLTGQMVSLFGSGKSKEVLAQKQAFLEANAMLAPKNVLTKQQIQFKTTTISQELMAEAQKAAERDIVDINLAYETDSFPMQGGVRFPNDKCLNCPMRGNCSGDAKLRDELVFRDVKDEFDDTD